MTWRERYAPFGEELLNPAANNDNTAYTGHLKDDASGLTYMQARYYDPVIGRFLSTDPIGYQDQLNLYAYVGNDPVNKVDPTGEFAQFALKFVVDVALEAGIQYATTGTVNVGSAVKDAATGLLNPAKTFERAKDLAKVAGKVADKASDRANAIQKAAGESRQGRTTTAVVETKEGTRVVGSSEPNLRPAQQDAMVGGEVAARGAGHAEVTAVNAAKQMGLTPTGVAASRPICSECAAFLKKEGVEPLTALKDDIK